MAENGGEHAAGMAVNGGEHAPAVAVHAANGVVENGGDQAPAAAVHVANGVVENGGDHAPAAAVHAENGVVENGGGHAPAAAVHAANGGDHAPAAAADAANGVANGPDPAPVVAVENGGNADLIHEEVAAANEVLDLSLIIEAATYEFFIRMPAAMVARGRAVCRTWRDVTSTEGFRREHHLRRSLRPMPLFFYRLDHQAVPDDDDHVRVHLRAADIHRRESFTVFSFAHLDPDLPLVDPRVFRIEGSCDGILLLSYDTRLYVCNPCTRRWTRLPPLHQYGDIAAFYARDLRSGGREYRALYHSGLNDEGCTYWILSFPNYRVRYIGRPTNVEAIDVVLAGGIHPSFEMPPILVRERLHWRPQLFQANSYLLVFDTADELFTWIRPPRVFEDNRWVQVDGVQLFENNGRLAMTVVSPTTVGVWVLQDYIGQVWTYEYQIQLPVTAIQANHGYVVTDGYEEPELSAAVFAVSEDRNVLIQCAHALLHCDANGTLLKTYRLPDNCTVLSRYMLQESLLLHAFLPLRPTDAQEGDPPFFKAP